MSAVIAVPDIKKHLSMEQAVTKEIASINISFVKDAKISYEYDIGRQLILESYLSLHLKLLLADKSSQSLSKHSLFSMHQECVLAPLPKNHCLNRENYSQSEKSGQASDESVFLY